MRYLLLLLITLPLHGDPWGKDSDLATPKKIESPPPLLPLTYQIARVVILFHQEWLSPTDGPRSHFYPSSSSYMLKAIEKHGLPIGFSLGCDRLMRENDDKWLYPTILLKGGTLRKLDPVP